ncbi:hypothetical protein BMS3Bbin04_00040 [bacterium BMS3Bbin04]|nr:hypothetical protein BMS3Bbin04_00040 [bacterium BMS3Bbin04]
MAQTGDLEDSDFLIEGKNPYSGKHDWDQLVWVV